jgi:phage/plasmid-like protein (TIGR03299 family)
VSHEYVSGFNGENTPAWHKLGIVIPGTVERGVALVIAGQDWRVVKRPVYVGTHPALPAGSPAPVGGAYVPVPGYAATVREDTNQVLGVVGKGFEPIQNVELYEFMDDVAGLGGQYVTAGVLADSKRVWALMKIPHEIQIDGLDTELVEFYLLGTNAHDGSRSLRLDVTPVRVVCANTETLALRSAVRTFALRHTSGIKGRIAEARKALDITYRYAGAFEKAASALLAEPMTASEWDTLLAELLPFPETKPGEKITERQKQTVKDNRQEILTVHRSAPNLQNVKDTKWGALQAVIEWNDYVRPVRAKDERVSLERSFTRQVDDVSGVKAQAFRILAPELAYQPGDNLRIERELAADSTPV